MNRQINLARRVRSFLLVLMGSFALAACGGGGGSGGSSSTGSVSVLVTDMPTEDYCEINVTITDVILIGENGQTTLYSDAAGKTLNLLELEHHSEVFSHTRGVPAGDYSKIRLVLDGGVQLKPDGTCDETSNSAWIEARVPSSKIDLNPQGEFTVAPDGVLVVELDMDAKAFKLTQTGNGQYLVRPVVFVDVMTNTGQSKLVRVFGTVTNKTTNDQGGSFQLCKTDIGWRNDDDDDDDNDNHNHNDDARCVTINALGDTSVFDGHGDPAAFEDVANDDPATVIGRIAVDEMEAASDDDEDDSAGDDRSDERIVLNAEVVELGVRTTYRRFTGLVQSVPADANDSFDFDFEPPQGFAEGTVVPVQLQDGTKLFSRDGDPLSVADFQVDQRAKVEGVMVVGASDFIKSSVVWLNTDADRLACEGTVAPISVDTTEPGSFEFVASETCWSTQTDFIVELSPGAVILLVTEEGGVLDHETITLEEMSALPASAYDATVYGTEQTDGTILADRIVLQASS